MQWDGTTTLHNNWGNAPTAVQPLNLELSLEMEADSIEVFPLDPMGVPKDSFMVAPQSDGKFILTLDQSDLQSVWFGIRSYRSTVNSSTNEFKQLKLFPNPAHSILNITGEFNNCIITIMNTLGQTTKELHIANTPVDVDISDLKAGLYFVRVRSTTQAKMSLRTIIKQ